MTDNSKPISASNPPPSKVRLRVQDSPVSNEKTLQRDQRKLDVEQREVEDEVAIATESKKKRTKITDK